MEIIGRRLSLQEFQDYVRDYYFGPKPPNKLVVHHTWRPTSESWQGERTIGGLKRYYEGKGWPAGPHLFIADDGIWLFSPMRKNGIHAGRLNDLSVGIEVVGDYDLKPWEGNTKRNTLGAIKVLQQRLSIPQSEIYFHRDVSGKTCPGTAITKDWLFNELNNFRMGPRIPTRREETMLPTDDEVEIVNTVSVIVPEWAKESVDFIRQHNLFEIRSADDVRDAVKFHRLYKLIKD